MLTRLRPHGRYAVYVAKHKAFVAYAGVRFTHVALWRLVVHDASKLSRAEWGPYVRRFMSGRAGVEDKTGDPHEFAVAWAHHWHANTHHWEHWLSADGAPMPMPEHAVREMVADWIGAGRSITGQWDLSPWYAATRPRMVLHPLTAIQVDVLIAQYMRTIREA